MNRRVSTSFAAVSLRVEVGEFEQRSDGGIPKVNPGSCGSTPAFFDPKMVGRFLLGDGGSFKYVLIFTSKLGEDFHPF